MDNKYAKLEEECNTLPTCTPPAMYNPENCMCVTRGDESALTLCSSNFQQSFFQGECVCATAISLQCSPGFRLFQSRNCQCVGENGETIEPRCPPGSSRPASNPCYCLLLQEPTCGIQDGVFSSDKCTCTKAKFTTPKCSDPDFCRFNSDSCSCS